MATRNIILDFGGILFEVDYMKTEKAFVDAGITDFRALYSQHTASPLFADFETGRIGIPEFLQAFRDLTGTHMKDEEIIRCWDSMLGSYYPEALEWVKNLRERYAVYLYSNTNAIHYNFFTQRYFEQFGRRDFEQHFDRVYYSHVAHHRKPNPESYTWLLADAGLNAADTLFIDDTLVNVEGARKAGLGAYHLATPEKVWQLAL